MYSVSDHKRCFCRDKKVTSATLLNNHIHFLQQFRKIFGSFSSKLMIIFESLSDHLLVLFTCFESSFNHRLIAYEPFMSNLSVFLGVRLLSFISHIYTSLDSFLQYLLLYFTLFKCFQSLFRILGLHRLDFKNHIRMNVK